MKYLENVGANCSNCGTRGNKSRCNDKCLKSENLCGWEPAPGVKVAMFEVWHGNKRGVGRQIIKESEVV